jgi:hypothetical protein
MLRVVCQLCFREPNLRSNHFLQAAEDVLQDVGQRAIGWHGALHLSHGRQSRDIARPSRKPKAAATSNAGPGLFFTTPSTSDAMRFKSCVRI